MDILDHDDDSHDFFCFQKRRGVKMIFFSKLWWEFKCIVFRSEGRIYIAGGIFWCNHNMINIQYLKFAFKRILKSPSLPVVQVWTGGNEKAGRNFLPFKILQPFRPPFRRPIQLRSFPILLADFYLIFIKHLETDNKANVCI